MEEEKIYSGEQPHLRETTSVKNDGGNYRALHNVHIIDIKEPKKC